jgi:PTS system fructose-specific IIA component/PTS system nitrogen regulatory IIA component
MRISDATAVCCPALEAVNKLDCIRQSVRLIFANDGLSYDATEAIVNGILKREILGSSGIGRGVALPHTKHNCVVRIRSGVFVLRPPLEYDSLDGEPVNLIICYISPSDRPGDHLRYGECVSRAFRNDDFVKSMIQCRCCEEMEKVLEEFNY